MKFSFAFLLLFSTLTFGQNPQSKKIIIDGKLDDWNGKFQYQKNTGTFYCVYRDTIAVYLAIRTIDKLMINKLISAGLTFSVNRSEKKVDKNSMSVTFPLPIKSKSIDINLKDYKKFKELNQEPSIDSLVKNNNYKMELGFKEIGVKGFPIGDTILSVYNDNGVKVSAKFDSEMSYIFELRIDKELLGLTKQQEFFFYNIKFNEVNLSSQNGLHVERQPDGSIHWTVSNSAVLPQKREDIPAYQSAVDFWDEYSLAKKP